MMTDFQRHQLRSAVELARSWFRPDGAEGETVHSICDGVESLLRENAVLRERNRVNSDASTNSSK